MTKQSGRSSAPTEPVDWFSNVTRVDLPDERVPANAADGDDPGTDPDESSGADGTQAGDESGWKATSEVTAESSDRTEPGQSRLMVFLPLLITAAILAAGFFLFANDGSDDADRTDDNADVGDTEAPATPTAQNGAAARAEHDGSLDRPYPFGLTVTLNYNDLEQGHSREWRVHVAESDLDGVTDDGGSTVMARVRLTYVDGTAPAATDDIVLRAVGPSGMEYSPAPDACGDPADRLPSLELAQGRSVEGWLCWPVPADDRSGLLLSVQAVPAEGVLYMTLDSQGADEELRDG